MMNNRDACQLLRKNWIKLGQRVNVGKKKKKQVRKYKAREDNGVDCIHLGIR